MNKRTLKKLNRELKEIEESLNRKEFILESLAKEVELKIERFFYDTNKCAYLLIDKNDNEVEVDDIDINNYIWLCGREFAKWSTLFNKIKA